MAGPAVDTVRMEHMACGMALAADTVFDTAAVDTEDMVGMVGMGGMEGTGRMAGSW